MGSGGGGSSGKVDFPEYMKTWHTAFLGSSSPSVTLTEAMNSAMTGNSPYAGFVGVNVNDAVLGSGKVVTDFGSPFTYLETYANVDFVNAVETYRSSNNNGLNTFITDVNTKTDAFVNAQSAALEADLNQNILPKYKTGSRDANVVMSSAYVIGEAILRASKAREVNRTDTALRLEGFKLNADLILKNEQICFDYATKQILSKRDIASTAMDFAKLYVGMRTEIDDANIEMDAKDRLWDLKTFQYGGNFLGAISGSSLGTDKGDGKSKMASTVSGAVGGAAMGASTGAAIGSGYPGIGTAIGAAVGAIAGWLSS